MPYPCCRSHYTCYILSIWYSTSYRIGSEYWSIIGLLSVRWSYILKTKPVFKNIRSTPPISICMLFSINILLFFAGLAEQLE